MEEITTPLLVGFGFHHKTTPLEVRERLSLDTENIQDLEQRIQQFSPDTPLFILATCNRVEIYAMVSQPRQGQALQQLFEEYLGVDHGWGKRYLFQHQGEDALLHLFRVASGLESQILGEAEILGQFKDAFTRSQENRTLGPGLHRFCEKAIQAAKWVRTHTETGKGQVSLAMVSVHLARKIFEQTENLKCLVIGAGEIGWKTAEAFSGKGTSSITIANRTFEKSVELARMVGGRAVPFDAIDCHLLNADVVICSTSSKQVILPESRVREATQKRTGRPLCLLDLALPRDIDPASGKLANTYLFNLDDLARMAASNRQARAAEFKKADRYLKEKADRDYSAWSQRITTRTNINRE